MDVCLTVVFSKEQTEHALEKIWVSRRSRTWAAWVRARNLTARPHNTNKLCNRKWKSIPQNESVKSVEDCLRIRQFIKKERSCTPSWLFSSVLQSWKRLKRIRKKLLPHAGMEPGSPARARTESANHMGYERL
ncbi:hypothetical protein AVEN_115476-1 [Araneus ventricosus]|uniref:Uncharacterized protein n=1 Tax=Araneus ventricosus TaxID=182803 RepID=A0A4Y2RZB1_ARAVE|nr:hypothetical protein AVEN_115476-1 [Araneus ventricosus]